MDVRPPTPPQVRRVIIRLRQEGRTYGEIAELVGVGTATVNRILRRKRETGDVIPKPKGGNNPRRVDLAWLGKHAVEFPDARIVDRMAAWKAHSGKSSSLGAMWNALRVIGWSHKKRRLLPGNETGRKSKRSDEHS